MHLVAGVDIRDVQFDDRTLEVRDRIDDCNRAERVSGGIDVDGVRAVTRGNFVRPSRPRSDRRCAARGRRADSGWAR